MEYRLDQIFGNSREEIEKEALNKGRQFFGTDTKIAISTNYVVWDSKDPNYLYSASDINVTDVTEEKDDE